MRIVHMTSVHRWNDIRILYKMCHSLSKNNFDVHFIVPRRDGVELEKSLGVTIHGVEIFKNRIERILKTRRLVIEKAKRLKADIYHFHDPEFLTSALNLKRSIKKPVIYDAHEDIRLHILSKEWLPLKSNKCIAYIVGRIEDYVSKQLNVVAATPWIILYGIPLQKKCAQLDL